MMRNINEDKVINMLGQINGKLDAIDNRLNSMDSRLDTMDGRLDTIDTGQGNIEKKLDAVYNQTADLTEFRTETRQGISDIKDTLRFVLHKEIEAEKEIFILKEKTAHLDGKEGLK